MSFLKPRGFSGKPSQRFCVESPAATPVPAVPTLVSRFSSAVRTGLVNPVSRRVTRVLEFPARLSASREARRVKHHSEWNEQFFVSHEVSEATNDLQWDAILQSGMSGLQFMMESRRLNLAACSGFLTRLLVENRDAEFWASVAADPKFLGRPNILPEEARRFYLRKAADFVRAASARLPAAQKGLGLEFAHELEAHLAPVSDASRLEPERMSA